MPQALHLVGPDLTAKPTAPLSKGHTISQESVYWAADQAPTFLGMAKACCDRSLACRS